MEERELWAAVLLRAVMDFTGDAHDVSKRERQFLQRAARLWFTSHSDHLGSFVWVCGELNLPPGRLRAQILAAGSESSARSLRKEAGDILNMHDGGEAPQSASAGFTAT